MFAASDELMQGLSYHSDPGMGRGGRGLEGWATCRSSIMIGFEQSPARRGFFTVLREEGGGDGETVVRRGKSSDSEGMLEEEGFDMVMKS